MSKHEADVKEAGQTSDLSEAPPPYSGAAPGTYYLGAIVPNLNTKEPSLPGFDPNNATDAIKEATQGYISDDYELLVSTLLKLSVAEMDAVARNFESKNGINLPKYLDENVHNAGRFKMAVHGLAAGPLMWDVDLVFKAIDGFITDEDILVEVLLGRPVEEITLLKDAFRSKHGKDLTEFVHSHISGKAGELFVAALSGDRTPDSVGVDPKQVEKDVEALHGAANQKNATVFCDILVNRNQPHLTAVIGSYNEKYGSLSKVIKSDFSSTFKHGLLYIVYGAKPKRDGQGVWRDAKMIYKTMAGWSCNDVELTRRVVRAHWNPVRFEAIKQAFKERTQKNLGSKVTTNVGNYRSLVRLLVAIANGERKL